MLGDRAVHPAWRFPAGSRTAVTCEARPDCRRPAGGAGDRPERGVRWGREALERMAEEALLYGNFPSLFLGLIGEADWSRTAGCA